MNFFNKKVFILRKYFNMNFFNKKVFILSLFLVVIFCVLVDWRYLLDKEFFIINHSLWNAMGAGILPAVAVLLGFYLWGLQKRFENTAKYCVENINELHTVFEMIKSIFKELEVWLQNENESNK